MEYYMNYRQLIFVFIFCSANLFSMKKQLPELTRSLHEITPEYEDFHCLPQQGSWEPAYGTLNSWYHELLSYKETHREWVKEKLPIIGKGKFINENGKEVTLNYSPAWYALGVMELEDGNLEKAANYFQKVPAIAKYRPQERKANLHACFAYALTLIEQEHYSTAAVNLAKIFGNLQKHERPIWEKKVRDEITNLVNNNITMAWRSVLALLLSNKPKDRNMALMVWGIFTEKVGVKVPKEHKEDIAETTQLIYFLAKENLSAHAQSIVSYIYLNNRNKPSHPFKRNKSFSFQKALEKSLKYIRKASVPDCEIAEAMRGDIAYRLAEYLEKESDEEDTATQDKIWELFQESAACGYSNARLRCTVKDLNNPEKIKDSPTLFKELNRLADEGTLVAREILSHAYFLGHTFESGCIIPADLSQAYKHANQKKQMIEMMLIKGLIDFVGLKKESKASKKNKTKKKKSPEHAKLCLNMAIKEDSEKALFHLDEYYKNSSVCKEIKDFIASFVEEKYKTDKDKPLFIKSYAILQLRKGELDSCIKLLEKLSIDYQDPHGYIELATAYLCGDGFEENLGKATNYCIKALRFFTLETIRYEGAKQTTGCITQLISKLRKPEYQTEKNQVYLSLLTNALGQYDIEIVEKTKKQAIDSPETNSLG